MAEVGLYLPQVRMSFDRIVDRVLTAEECGFQGVWFIDHLATPADNNLDLLEGWTVASAVAARTERIRLGHLVLCDPFRHPALLAKMACSLDVISNGRLDLGIGWGSVDAEFDAFGIEPRGHADRVSRLTESLEILERLFTGEPVDHDGRWFQLRGAVCRPTPVQSPIPIHIGGAGPRFTMPLVRRFATWWNCPVYGFDRLAELRPLSGDTRLSVQHVVALAPSTAALPDVEAAARRRFGTWGGLVVGTPDGVAATLAAEAAAGAELFVVQFSDFATPETQRLFAAEVMPALRGA